MNTDITFSNQSSPHALPQGTRSNVRDSSARATLPIRACLKCGKDFQPRGKNQKYCGHIHAYDSCAWKVDQKKKKQKKNI